jgi:hypothetical protein
MMPTLLSILVVLAIYPASRELLFPPAPIALISSKNGSVQKPKAGVLGSKDSVTGAPEKFRGEAVEQEASTLISSITSLALQSTAGKHDQAVPDDAPMESSVPDPADVVSETADSAVAAREGILSEEHDKTKQPMMEVVQEKTRQLMRLISGIIDTYERFGKYVVL